MSIALFLVGIPSAQASFTINLDYTHDDGLLFGSGTAARAALEAAAADISALIGDSLGAITNDPVSASVGGTTVEFNPTISYTNPDTGVSTTLDLAAFPLAADEFRVYVGAQDLAGTTIAQGGQAKPGIGWGHNGGTVANIQAAQDAAEAAFNAEYDRGGPVYRNRTGTFGSIPGTDYSVNVGATVGYLWFDTDTDNAGGTDNATTLGNYYHEDHTTSVTSGQIDIYTVALHEILHAVGFGTSDPFDDNISGTVDWTGTEVGTLLGSGSDVLHTDSSHINHDNTGNDAGDSVNPLTLTSIPLGGGAAQAPVMHPTISSGQRRFLTELDAAFIADMGWSIVPEVSGTLILIPLLGAAVCCQRRRRSQRTC